MPITEDELIQYCMDEFANYTPENPNIKNPFIEPIIYYDNHNRIIVPKELQIKAIHLWNKKLQEFDWTNITGANTGKYNDDENNDHEIKNHKIKNIIFNSNDFDDDYNNAPLVLTNNNTQKELIIDIDEQYQDQGQDQDQEHEHEQDQEQEQKNKKENTKKHEINNDKNIYKYLFFIVLMCSIVFIFITYRKKINKEFLFQ